MPRIGRAPETEVLRQNLLEHPAVAGLVRAVAAAHQGLAVHGALLRVVSGCDRAGAATSSPGMPGRHRASWVRHEGPGLTRRHGHGARACAALGAAVARAPAVDALPPAHRRRPADQRGVARVPPRRLADPRRKRAGGDGAADARQLRGGRAHPAADRPERPLRARRAAARRTWPLWLRWSVSKVQPRRRDPRRRVRSPARAWLCCVHDRRDDALAGPDDARRSRVVAWRCSRSSASCVVRGRHARRRGAARTTSFETHPPASAAGASIAVFWVAHAPSRAARRRARRRRDRLGLAGLGARAGDVLHRLAVAAPAARPDHASSARPRTPRSCTFDYGVHAGGRVGGRHQPQPAARVARVRHGRRRRGAPGYRLLISRAGDWTGRFIDARRARWVRGTPVSAPMAKVALL